MNIKSKKILAQLLAVAVAGSAFAVPVAVMSKPVINVSAEDTVQENGWKKAYADFLKEEHTKNNATRFALAYVDDNDVPELVTSLGSYHAVGSLAYVYNNGNVVQLTGGGSDYGHFDYVEKGNIMYSSHTTNGNGGIGQALYCIKNGEAERIVYFYESDSLETGDRIYNVDDVTVTKDQYDAKLKEYQMESGTNSVMGKSLTSIPYASMYEITDENINNYIGVIEEETEQGVKNVDFERKISSNNMEYGIFTAKDASGNTVWTYKTKACPVAQCASITPLGQRNGVYYLVEGNTVTALALSSGKILWQNNDFKGSGVCSAFGENAIYIGSYLAPDFCAVSYDGEIVKTISHLDEDYINSEYYWVDNITIVDEKYAAVHFEANDKTLYVDLQTYEVYDSKPETPAEKPKVTYEWFVEPSIEADNINTVGVFMGSILDKDAENYEDYEYDYGRFIDTGYAVIKEGDFYGVISMEGDMVIEPDYVSIRGDFSNHFVLVDEDDDITYFCCETGEFLDPEEPYCAWCEESLSTCVCGSYYCYDPEKDLLAYIGEMPENEEAPEVVYLDSQNGSNGAVDFPEGKAIPVRKVSIDGNDVTLTDDYGIMKDGEVVIDFNYYNALSYKDGITALKSDDGWYYFNEDGELLIDAPCDASYSFGDVEVPYLPSEDYIAFNTIYGGGYYATDGEVVIPVGEFAEVRPVFNSLAWVKDHETGLWGVIELTGERAVIPDNNDNNDSDSDDDGNSSGGNSSSNGSAGKDSPKTGDDSGKVFALLALSAGVMVASRKRREK